MNQLARLSLFLCLALLVACPAAAKTPSAKALPAAPSAASGGDGPLDISAEESLEWHEDQKLYVARGAARAMRGDTSVEADLLTAHQREKTDGAKSKKAEAGAAGGDIDIITAEGNVRIKDPKQQVFGDRAVYNLDRKSVKITGGNLKYVTEKNVVTARDSLEFDEAQMTAVARGRAVALHAGSRIEADVLAANFVRSPSGQMEMDRMTARGNVTIVTKDDSVSKGEAALYDVKKDTALLTGNVRVTRGQTQLAGDKAEVNFATGQSRLINSGSGRVRALLPTSSKAKDK